MLFREKNVSQLRENLLIRMLNVLMKAFQNIFNHKESDQQILTAQINN